MSDYNFKDRYFWWKNKNEYLPKTLSKTKKILSVYSVSIEGYSEKSKLTILKYLEGLWINPSAVITVWFDPKKKITIKGMLFNEIKDLLEPYRLEPDSYIDKILNECTPMSAMPKESQYWFIGFPLPNGGRTYRLPKGKMWDYSYKNGKWPVLVDIPLPTKSELKKIEIDWRNGQLRFTDKYSEQNIPLNKEQKEALSKFKKELRDYPDQKEFPKSSSRPKWPTNLPKPV